MRRDDQVPRGVSEHPWDVSKHHTMRADWASWRPAPDSRCPQPRGSARRRVKKAHSNKAPPQPCALTALHRTVPGARQDHEAGARTCASLPTPMHPLPQLAGTRDRRAGMVLLHAQRHMRRSRYPRSSPRRGTHATPFSLFRISHAATTTRGGLGVCVQSLFLLQGSHPLFGRPFSRTHTHASSFGLAVFVHAHAARARPHARTRTNDRRRTTRRAVRRRG